MHDTVIPLSESAIRAAIRSELSHSPIFCYDSTDSTNRQAKYHAEENFTGCAVFAANSQTAGRGRLGRQFYSPADTGVYFSFLFSSAADLFSLSAVTPAAAVAAAFALEEMTGRRIGIKWVNDLYIDERKIAGILTEAIAATDAQPYNKIIVGIGINLSTSDFPSELADIAGAVGCLPDRNILIARIVNRLYDFVSDPLDRTHMAEYTARSTVLGKKVRMIQGRESTEGIVRGFDENGGLILDVGKDTPKIFTGGEISLRLC